MLIDHVRASFDGSSHQIAETLTPEMREGWKARLDSTSLLVINADDVAQYFDSISEKLPVMHGSGIVNAAPPSPLIWVEWSPRRLVSWMPIHPGWERYAPKRIGILAQGIDLSYANNRALLLEAQSEVTEEIEQMFIANRWLVTMEAVHMYDASIAEKLGVEGEAFHFLTVILCCFITSYGKITETSYQIHPEMHSLMQKNTSFSEWIDLRWCALSKVPLMTFSFLHSKNVSLQPNLYTEKQQKARQKIGRRPFIRYHTIHIHPPSMQKKAEHTTENSERSGLPLHQVRGHFADYRSGQGLFGKIHGLFWVPQHLRGTVAEGLVKKRYVIHEPNTQELIL